MSLSSVTPTDRNLQLLFLRQKGQRFLADREGKLRLITSFWDKVRYFFNRFDEQKKVSLAITRTLRSLKPQESDRKVVERLFYERLKNLSTNVFDRGAGVSDEMEAFLAPELSRRKQEYSENKDDLAEYAWKVERVRFALKLGVKFKPISQGTNGSYFGLDRYRKKMVVFKPANEQGVSRKNPKLISRIKRKVCHTFPVFKTHGNIDRKNVCWFEIGASIVDRFLDLKIVPITRSETFTSDAYSEGCREKKGSCQLFVHGTTDAASAYGIPYWLPHALQTVLLNLFYCFIPHSLKREQFEMLAIFDFLTGNQDRHFDNFLVKEGNVVAIDNSISFPFEKPSGYFSKRFMYYWGHLPQSRTPFSKAAQSIVEKLADRTEREKLYRLLEVHLSSAFRDAQKNEMEEKINILIAAVKSKSPYYLSKIKTANDYVRARQELGL